MFNVRANEMFEHACPSPLPLARRLFERNILQRETSPYVNAKPPSAVFAVSDPELPAPYDLEHLEQEVTGHWLCEPASGIFDPDTTQSWLVSPASNLLDADLNNEIWSLTLT